MLINVGGRGTAMLRRLPRVAGHCVRPRAATASHCILPTEPWKGTGLPLQLYQNATCAHTHTHTHTAAVTKPAIGFPSTQPSWENPGRQRSTAASEPTAHRGEIQLVMGPMFSGKSSELVRRLNRYSYANLRCVVVKHSIDDRFAERNAETEYLSTHDNVNVMKAERVRLLGDASHLLDAADVIGIDEGQFFEDLVPFCEHAAGLGKVVVVAALDGDFLRTGFPSVVELIPKCESVVKLTAVCAECGHAAAFSRRLVSDTSTTLIGGRKEYAPVCRQHWLEPPAVTQ